MGVDIFVQTHPFDFETGAHPDTQIFHVASFPARLIAMMKASGLYGPLFQPNEYQIAVAWDLVAPLNKGLDELYRDPEFYEQFDDTDGWVRLTSEVDQLLTACEQNPRAFIHAEI